MIYLCILCLVLLLGGIIFTMIRYEDTEKRHGLDRILLPAGTLLWNRISRTAERILPSRLQKKEKNRMLRTWQDISGPTEGRRRYDTFQSRRIGYLLGVGVLFLSFYLAEIALSSLQEETGLDFSRPAYGQKSRSQPVTLTLSDGEETVGENLTLQIPAKKLTAEEEGEWLRKAVAYLEKTDGATIRQKLVLPENYGPVQFSYTSLSPDELRSDGTLLQEAGREERILRLRVVCKVGASRDSLVLSFRQPALSELSLKERLDGIIRRIGQGEFLEEDSLNLPTADSLGDVVAVHPVERHSGSIWLFAALAAAAAILLFQREEVNSLWKKRDQQMLLELPELMEELSILLRAGLSLPAAFIRLGQDYRAEQGVEKEIRFLFEEIARVGQELSEGESFRVCMEQLMVRAPLPQLKRLIRMLMQSERRGTGEILERLSEMTAEAWEERKKQVRELSETADTKLVFPLMLLLLAVLVVVLAPSLLSLS